MKHSSIPMDIIYFFGSMLMRNDLKNVKVTNIMNIKNLNRQGNVIKEYIKLIKKTCVHWELDNEAGFLGHDDVHELYYHLDRNNFELLVMMVMDNGNLKIVNISTR